MTDSVTARMPLQDWLCLVRHIQYSDGKGYFRNLSPERQEAACRLACTYNLAPYIYWALSDALPQGYRATFQRTYQRRSALQLQHQYAWSQLRLSFEKHHIRHCPFKGLELAWRVYPSPALRCFADWDILVHPDDCDAALELLKQEHWDIPRPDALDEGHHHYCRHCKNGFELEIHRNLPGFATVSSGEIWELLQPSGEGSYGYRLPPELNVLLQIRHASAMYYLHVPLTKVLLDISFLLKHEACDWEKARSLAEQWKFPLPDDFLGAWRDFFPEDVLKPMRIDREQSLRFRQLFMFGYHHRFRYDSSWSMQSRDALSASWFAGRLAAMTPRRIRSKYNLPPNSLGGLLNAYWREIMNKGRGFVNGIRYRDLKMRAYMRMAERLEARYTRGRQQEGT